MSDDPKTPAPSDVPQAAEPAEPAAEFDAIAAAEELEASLDTDAESATEPPPSGAYAEILEEEVVALSALVDERNQRIHELEVESEKATERIEREAAKALRARVRKLLLGFLEVMDDLDRALEAARSMDHNPAVLEGVELVRRSFLSKLSQMGVTPQNAAGLPFDPNHHDAVAVVPVDDAAQDGIIVGVARSGYAIDGEPLRPAQVAVGRVGGA